MKASPPCSLLHGPSAPGPRIKRYYAYVFVSERGGPGPIGFHRLIQRLGDDANMPFPIHLHMLRQACRFKLANDGHGTRALQPYLGHKNIQHTVRSTEMAAARFKDFWRCPWARSASAVAFGVEPSSVSSKPLLSRL